LNTTRFLKQKAVYWARAGQDVHANPTYSAGVEVSCRWESSDEEVVGPDETKIVSHHLALVDQDMINGSLIWLGELASWTGSDPPTASTTDVFSILSLSKIPDMTAENFVREIKM